MANKTVLCFGDSNTFGYDPQGVASGTRFRYPVDVRWPGVLHELLGPDWRFGRVADGARNVVLSSFGEHSVRVSHEVAEAYRVVADEQGCAYLDASKVCEPSPIDHIHMTPPRAWGAGSRGR